jgi:hypothetical protein
MASLGTHTGLLCVLTQGYSRYSHRGRVHTQRQRKGCIGAAAQRRGTHSTAGYSAARRPRHCGVLVGTHGRWIYDADPLAHLKFEQPLGELKRRIAESGSSYFQAKMGPTPGTSAPGLGPSPPHRHRDCAPPRRSSSAPRQRPQRHWAALSARSADGRGRVALRRALHSCQRLQELPRNIISMQHAGAAAHAHRQQHAPRHRRNGAGPRDGAEAGERACICVCLFV